MEAELRPAPAAEVAAGSGLVLAGNIASKALRLASSWILANALGTVGFGVYEQARTLATIVAAAAPLGSDKGVVYFAASQQARGDAAGLKGTARILLWTAAVGVPLFCLAAAGLVGALPGDPAVRRATLLMMPAALLWALLMMAVAALRAVKDLRSHTLAWLVVLPAGMALGSLLALPWGLDGANLGFFVANLVALLWVLPPLRQRWAPALAAAGEPRLEWRNFLSFSVPETFSAMLFRLNQWTDTLMVGWLAGNAEAGVYRVAATLAMVGDLPGLAVTTALQPVVAELHARGERERLRHTLRSVTRWLVIAAAPLYIAMYVGQDLLLRLWDSAYAGAGAATSSLVLGQAATVLVAPASSLISMSGNARLNLVNTAAATALNVALNAYFIPRMGAEGAALATGLSLAAWSAWRLAEVAWMGVQPFTGRALGLMAVAVALGWGARRLSVDAALLGQAGAALGALALFGGACWLFGTEPEDAALLAPIRRRLIERVGRGG